MSAQLVPVNAKTCPKIPLQRPVLLIGRHPECDVRLDLPKISRRHCCVALAYDRVMIRDLGSRNGLRVNGRLVEEAQLHPGDEVAIGPIIYRVESLLATPPTPPARPSAVPTAKPPSFPALPDRSQNADDDLVELDF